MYAILCFFFLVFFKIKSIVRLIMLIIITNEQKDDPGDLDCLKI